MTIQVLYHPSITCPLCSYTNVYHSEYLKNGYNLVECERCGEMFVVNISVKVDCKMFTIETKGGCNV